MQPAAQKPSYLTLAQLFEPIRDDLKKVEAEFARHVESQVPLIPAMGKYVQSGGGKRIRPAVLLMAARMAGYKGEYGPLFGAVVEFIHTATLVHDDIIDESEVRRGRQAVHAKWGNDVTVLLGDFLYIKSMSMALTRDSLDVIKVLCEVTLRMIEGEIYQLTKNGVVDLSEAEHLDIVRRKTAYLFAGAAKIGGMLGAATPEELEALWEYGFNIGIAFQLVDDLLDYTGDEDVLGKPIGGDLCEGKMTLPVIHLIRGAQDPRGTALIMMITESGKASLTQWQELKALLAKNGSIEYAYETASDYVKKAKRALSAFPASAERDALMYLPDYVLSRDR